jgi:hypothetical protein
MVASRWQKFNRGEQQLKLFKDEIDRFADPGNQEPIRYRENIDRDQPAWVVTIHSVPDLPGHWELLIGEIIQNFRGALDHLVWDLAILNIGKEPVDRRGRPWRTQFPICANEADWKTSTVGRMVAPLSPNHRAAIEEFQPYGTWQGNCEHPFLALDDLSNADKHRVSNPALFGLGSVEMTFDMADRDCHVLGGGNMTYVAGRPLRFDTEILRLPLRITGPDPKMSVDLKVSAYVGFPNGKNATLILDDIAILTRAVLARLEPDLSTPAAVELRERIAEARRKSFVRVPFSVETVNASLTYPNSRPKDVLQSGDNDHGG